MWPCKLTLSDEQVRLLERFSPEFRERHIEAPQSGALVGVDTFFVGTLKGVGKVYLQTAIDCHSRYAWARLYRCKLPITAVQLTNGDVIPTFEDAGATIDIVRSDRCRQFCGRPNRHPYELFLQLEAIEHRTAKVKRPQSNGIAECQHRTLLDEHFRIEGHRTWFETIEEMQCVLDDYLVGYNTRRPHQGRGMVGRTPAPGLRRRPAQHTGTAEGVDAENSQSRPSPNGAALSGDYPLCTDQARTTCVRHHHDGNLPNVPVKRIKCLTVFLTD